MREAIVAKEQSIRLTKFELEIMDALWGLGSASVREIQEQLPARKRPAYTTVQTIIYRLEEKGAVRRVKKIGNAHVFEAVVSRKAAHRRLVDELLDFFGGSPQTLVAQLVETGRLTLDDVRELEGTLATLAEGKAGGGAAADAGSAEKGRAASKGGAGRERSRK
ncbi:MAG TPA: BlaI/MecI/CopY family transcriptional regulator [Pyrinomonadaceae bacterium]|jgi:predicted transcriptional regulator|nr:BlaI/MecI/CopY family transcriptional regulator [Pyrinomonadaceae bacterium]